MSNQKRKRNHWVSQGYLRSFAADSERSKLWIFSKDGGDPKLKPIQKVAVRFYLYAPRGPEGRDYSFEEKLASLEQWFGSSLWADISGGFVDLCDPTVREMASLLVAVMYLRNPLRLAMTEDMHRSLVELISQCPELPDALEINGRTIPVDQAAWPAYRDASEDDIRRSWIKDIRSPGWLAKLLMKMRWAVMVSETPAFITTDNPVVPLHPDLTFRGLNNPDTSIVMPLSPTRLLWLDHRHHEPDGQYYPVKDSAAPMNGLLWRNSIEYMFSSRHTDHVCAEMLDNARRGGFI